MKRRSKQTPRKRELTNRRAALKRKAKGPSTKSPSPFPRHASANKPTDWVAGEDYNARAEQPSWPPNKIKIGTRHRKDLGDIKSLAADINERGLLHPIVVDLKNNLIAGERRLAAWKISNFRDQAIPIHTVPLTDLVSGEWAENDPRLRQNFTPSETVEIKRAIEKKLKPAAQQRIAHGKTAPGRGAEASIAEERTRDRAAAFTGKTSRTIEKAEQIVDAARDEPEKYGALKETMDRTGKVNGPFNRLKNLRAAEKIRTSPAPLPMQGPYHAGLIDIPWASEPDDENKDHGGRGYYPYPTMTPETAAKIPVGKMLAKDASVWLWITNYHLIHGHQLVIAKAWGLKPVALLTWVKRKYGQGQRMRGATEHVIQLVRGKVPCLGFDQRTWFDGEGGEHSQKPDDIYTIVEKLSPAPRYFELFSRSGPRERWDLHGDQVGKFAPAVARSAEAALLKEATENGAVLDAISHDEELKILEVASSGQTAWSSKLADQLKKKGLIAGDQKWRMTSKGRVRLADLRRKARATAKTLEAATA